jgi:hypothetical protein
VVPALRDPYLVVAPAFACLIGTFMLAFARRWLLLAVVLAAGVLAKETPSSSSPRRCSWRCAVARERGCRCGGAAYLQRSTDHSRHDGPPRHSLLRGAAVFGGETDRAAPGVCRRCARDHCSPTGVARCCELGVVPVSRSPARTIGRPPARRPLTRLVVDRADPRIGGSPTACRSRTLAGGKRAARRSGVTTLAHGRVSVLH